MQRDINRFKEILNTLDIEDTDGELVDKFTRIIERECSPEEYFLFLGSGSFKECYRLNDKFIIKFCSEENETNSEYNLISEAVNKGVGDIFLQTEVGYLQSCELPSMYLDCDGSEKYYYNSKEHTFKRNPDYAPPYFVAYFIQPYVDIIAIYDHPREDYADPPFHFGIENNSRWEANAIEWYGEEFCRNFDKFTKEFHVWDLANRNIGWIVEEDKYRPVIIDWMS